MLLIYFNRVHLSLRESRSPTGEGRSSPSAPVASRWMQFLEVSSLSTCSQYHDTQLGGIQSQSISEGKASKPYGGWSTHIIKCTASFAPAKHKWHILCLLLPSSHQKWVVLEERRVYSWVLRNIINLAFGRSHMLIQRVSNAIVTDWLLITHRHLSSGSD